MLVRAKRFFLNFFIKIIPARYRRTLIIELCEKDNSLDIDVQRYELLDYSKHTIYMYKGVRSTSCKKEPETVSWIENYIKAGETLFDIGANVGAYSLIAAKYHKGTVKVYAFEPTFHTFPILVKNILKNNCEKIIFPLIIPLDKVSKLAKFNYKSLREGTSLHVFDGQIYYKGNICQPEFEQFMVSMSIDKLIREYQLPKPNHIKLDVDGTEFEILCGSENTLSDNCFKTLLVECEENQHKLSELTLFLEKCGLLLSKECQHEERVNNYIFTKA